MNEITTHNGVATGVVLDDGKHIESSCVLSNATPKVTFDKLLPPSVLEGSEYMKHIRATSYESPVTKINGNTKLKIAFLLYSIVKRKKEQNNRGIK